MPPINEKTSDEPTNHLDSLITYTYVDNSWAIVDQLHGINV